MNKNGIATALKVVGVLEAIGGIIVTIVVAIDNFIEIWGSILIGSLLVCLFMFAFAEVIQLLQNSVDTQRDILKHLAGDSKNGQKSTTTVIQDIEANLPPM